MSKSHRKHESHGKRDKRGPNNKYDDDLPKSVRKTFAESRRTDKQALRKAWR